MCGRGYAFPMDSGTILKTNVNPKRTTQERPGFPTPCQVGGMSRKALQDESRQIKLQGIQATK